MRTHAVPELDGVRALAVLAVLAYHIYGRIQGGFLGVDLFFVLSGFLITTLLIDEYRTTGRINIPYFFARRALRILPPLFACVLLTIALWPNAARNDLTNAIQAAMLFYANFADVQKLGMLGHTWSISVEEHFYLLWPALLMVLLIRGWRTTATVAALIFIASASIRIALYTADTDPWFLYRSTWTRLDAISAGCFTAIAFAFKPFRVPPPILVVAAIGISAALIFTTHLSPLVLTVGHTAFAVLAAIFLVGVLTAKRGHVFRKALSSSAMLYIGRRSYGLYLYHFPIFISLDPLAVEIGVVATALLKISFAFLAAELSFRSIEAVAMSYKDRFHWINSRLTRAPSNQHRAR